MRSYSLEVRLCRLGTTLDWQGSLLSVQPLSALLALVSSPSDAQNPACPLSGGLAGRHSG